MSSPLFSYLFSSKNMITRKVELSSSAKFTWKIKNFSQLNHQKLTCSDVLTVGSFKWKVCICPSESGDMLSLFLLAVDYSTELPYVEHSFTIISQTDCRNKVKEELKHNLAVDNRDQCWVSFICLGELHDPAKGYLVNDTCVINIDISCKVNEEPTNRDA